jgi:trimeric autotransporter adhesin
LGTATLSVSPASVTLQLIAVTLESPSNTSAGATQQFKAMGTLSDGTTQDLTTQVTWRSSDSLIASITQNGKTTALTEGTTTITAALGVVTGSHSLNVTYATASGTWEGTYTIYDAPYDTTQIGTYTFRFVLSQSDSSVTGTSSLRYDIAGQNAIGQITSASVTGRQINFTFTYVDPRYSRKMVNVGTATITDTSMTGAVLENYNGGYNCGYLFSLKKL